jgi:hypothetical protein
LKKEIENSVNPKFLDKFKIQYKNINVLSLNTPKYGRLLYFENADNIYQNNLKDAGTVDISPNYAIYSYLTGYDITSLGITVNGGITILDSTQNCIVFHDMKFRNTFPTSELNYKGTIINFNSQFQFTLFSDSDTIDTNIDGFQIITADNIKDFWEFSKSSIQIYIQNEIYNLYINDSNYKKYRDEPVLKTMASKIEYKKNKKELLKDDSYPLWEFDSDLKEFYRTSEKLGYEKNYIDRILNSDEIKPKSGTLIWYFESQYEYIFQWILIQIVIVFFLILNIKKIIPFNISRNEYLIFIIAVSGYIFNCKPEAVELYYYLIPALITLALILTVIKYFK